MTENARLRGDKRDLTQQLDPALAAIQRLSIDNGWLRVVLHDAQTVTVLSRRPRQSGLGGWVELAPFLRLRSLAGGGWPTSKERVR
ncbi:hypothetical protein ABZ622_39205 [Streptomyces sp. NPDC007164]|uniref:hypothetical protein n=1 Tax=Streptomyces sp. NPDC007164 TaxID=3156918 RepID=UPI0033EE8C06